jgi:hypothetical protein
LAADAGGNVYAAIGSGPQDGNNDGQSYVQVAGLPWTGTLHAKFRDSHPDFLNANNLDLSSSGPVILPGPTPRLAGSGSQGRFHVVDTSGMVPVVGGAGSSFRGAWNQFGPMQGDPGNLEPSTVACTATNGCDSNGVPVSTGGTQACCPQGCTALDGSNGCAPLVRESYPHVHGAPCYLDGAAFWWAEKDYPRFMTWDATQGYFTGSVERVSNDATDLAPAPSYGVNDDGHPGGLMSLSANGTKDALLWAVVPQDYGSPFSDANLVAFDVSNLGALPKVHIYQHDIGYVSVDGVFGARVYPTVANGIVYVTNLGCAACSSAIAQIMVFH